MDAPRPTSELAAEVERYLLKQTCSQEHHDALSSHRALVARVTDLEAQVAYKPDPEEWAEYEQLRERLAAGGGEVVALTATLRAEASWNCCSTCDQWSGTTQGCEECSEFMQESGHGPRVGELSDALATTRQALTQLLGSSDPGVREVARRALAATEKAE